MKLQYPILIEKGDKDTAWGIIVPDLPGCFSAADEETDILANAREAVLLHLESLDELPEPSSLEKHKAAARKAKMILALVDVDLAAIEGPAKRINITIPVGVLARIDAAAKAHGMNRSAFLTDAALKQI